MYFQSIINERKQTYRIIGVEFETALKVHEITKII